MNHNRQRYLVALIFSYMNIRSLLLLSGILVAGTATAQTRTKVKVGVNTKNPTENLHVNGTMRVHTLPLNNTANAISTKPDGSLDDSGNNQPFNAKYIVTADANGVLGRALGVEPLFFYMPAVCLPLKDEDIKDPYSAKVGSYTEVYLYKVFAHQYGLTATPGLPTVVKSNASAEILHTTPTANQFDYFITYYDEAVFEDLSVTADGVLKYKVKAGVKPTAKTFMNIVFKKK